jgi:hypothetical protein
MSQKAGRKIGSGPVSLHWLEIVFVGRYKLFRLTRKKKLGGKVPEILLLDKDLRQSERTDKRISYKVVRLVRKPICLGRVPVNLLRSRFLKNYKFK